jgi:hypothetical protein
MPALDRLDENKGKIPHKSYTGSWVKQSLQSTEIMLYKRVQPGLSLIPMIGADLQQQINYSTPAHML